jgi:ferric-dicitrate binding protein FerR (iron transport regulator)
MNQKEISNLLLDESFRNWALKANLNDFKVWEQYLKKHPEKYEVAQKAREIILFIELEEHDMPDDQNKLALNNLNKSIDGQVKPYGAEISLHTKRHKILYKSIAFIAAAIAFFVVYTWQVRHYENREIEQEEIYEIVKKTENGQKLTVSLPDGSKVKLNAGSTLSFTSNFTESRQVTLVGEAKFEVVKDEDRPFSIKTRDHTTIVLGTTFFVKAYPKKKIQISVVSGRVLVEKRLKDDNIQNIILNKEESTEFVEANGNFKYRVYVDDELGWEYGLLVFNTWNIGEIEDKIEKWYGVEMEIHKNLSIKETYSGKYLNSSLDEVLIGMSYVLKFNYSINGDKVLITK